MSQVVTPPTPVPPPTSPCVWEPRSRGRLPAPPAAGEVQLWLMSLDEPAWPSVDLHAVLDEAERQRASRFHFEPHRQRFAHGRGLLRHLLAHATGAAPEALRFELGPQGKPRLIAPDRRARLDFNLSHSGALALLGLSDGAAIGVDVELPRPVPELQAIAERNFAPAEQRSLAALPLAEQLDAFLAVWTRKEAFIKALGGGLSIPLDSFEVSLAVHEPARLVQVADPAHPPCAFTLWSARNPQGAWSAAVVRQAGASVQPFSLHP